MDGKSIFVIVVVSFVLLLSIIVKFKFRDNVEVIQEEPKPKDKPEIKKAVVTANNYTSNYKRKKRRK